MFAGSLEIGPDLGICEAHPVLVIAARTPLHDSGDHLYHRQDFPPRGVRLRLPSISATRLSRGPIPSRPRVEALVTPA